MTIKVNLEPLESASTLSYLGHTISDNNINWVSLYHNLSKAQRRWGMVSRVMVKAGVTVKSRAMVYKPVLQMLPMYGSESWIIIDATMKVL